MRGEHLTQATNQMAVGSEISFWEQDIVQSPDESRYLDDILVVTLTHSFML